MLRTTTLAFFIINALILGALALSYLVAAIKMKSKIIYSLAILFIILTITEIIGACSFIHIFYGLTVIAKVLSASAALTFLIYSYKKQQQVIKQ